MLLSLFCVCLTGVVLCSGTLRTNFASVGDYGSVGEQLRVCVQQGQPQPAVQHVRIRVSHPAQVPHDARGVHAQGRCVEPAEGGDEGAHGAVLPARRRGVNGVLPQPRPSDPHGVRIHHLHQGRDADTHAS